MPLVVLIRERIKDMSKEAAINYLKECIFYEEMADKVDSELVYAYRKVIAELETGD